MTYVVLQRRKTQRKILPLNKTENAFLICSEGSCNQNEYLLWQDTVKSRYLEVDGTIFYKFKLDLPEVQINLHFG